MKLFAALSAVVVLFSACSDSGTKTDNYEVEAQKGWDKLSSQEQELACLMYTSYRDSGKEEALIEKMMTGSDVHRTREEAEIGMKIFRQECE